MEFMKNFIRRYLIYNLSVSNDISGDARKDLGFTIYISRNFLQPPPIMDQPPRYMAPPYPNQAYQQLSALLF